MILLTGQRDRDVDIQAMRAGAADYLVKGRIDSSLLERSIRYSIQRRREQEAKEELSQVNEVMNLVDLVARIITSTLNIDAVYEKFALEVKKLVDFDRMTISLIDYERDIQEIKYLFVEEVPHHCIGATCALEHDTIRQVADTGRSLVERDIALNARSPIGDKYL